MMIECGLMARNAERAGLTPKPWVKTILAPGSHATELLLERAGLLGSLGNLGFATCGFGCMSCIGNSGPLMEAMHAVAGDRSSSPAFFRAIVISRDAYRRMYLRTT